MTVETRKPSALYISVSISRASRQVISGLDIAYGGGISESGFRSEILRNPIRILEQDATRKIPEYDDVERERILLSNMIGSSRAS